jgi:hypothetical protein
MKNLISILSGNIMQPTNNLLQPISTNGNGNMAAPTNQSKSPVPVGSTWSNSGFNLDLDNLLDKKKTSGPAPSMNQLKSIHSSPVHVSMPATATSPLSPIAINFPANNGSFNTILSPTAFQQPQAQQQQQPMFGNIPKQPFGGANAFVQSSQTNFSNFNAFQ